MLCISNNEMEYDMKTEKRTALVTGASSGIGRAFAHRLAQTGYDLIVVARRQDRLDQIASSYPQVDVRSIVADLGTSRGIEAVVEVCEESDLDLLVNNAGVAHYMPFVDLPAEKANELMHVKVMAPTLLARAAARRMVQRRSGAIINVAGMLAFSGPATLEKLPLRRAVYIASLAYEVAISQALSEELKAAGVHVQVVCPGVVSTEFHERQGLDMSKVPRMSAEDVVAASLKGLERGEVVCAPGVERSDLLEAVFSAELSVFGAQSPVLATRYQQN